MTRVPTSSTSMRVAPDAPRLLVVDDEPTILRALRAVFRSGYHLTTTTEPTEALSLLATSSFDVVISDQRMPTMTGVELLAKARAIAPTAVRMLLTGYADQESIVRAINEVEVHRYIQKPWDNLALRSAVDEAVTFARLRAAAVTAAPDELGIGALAVVPFPKPPGVPSLDGTPYAPPAPVRETLLVIGGDLVAFREAFEPYKKEVEAVCLAALGERESRLTEHLPCSVLVFHVEGDAARACESLREFRLRHPHAVIVVWAKSAPSDLLIDLINRAQIFRFVRGPANAGILSRCLGSALDEVRRLRLQRRIVSELKTTAAPGRLAPP